MDALFVDLIGKPKLNPPKIITIVADNFSLLADQARFLKATLAIPTVKQIPIDTSKRLIQIGSLPKEICDHIETTGWTVNHYMNDANQNLCDKLSEDLLAVNNRSIMFFNDISRLELMDSSKSHRKKLLVLIEKLKRLKGHFPVIFYQNSIPNYESRLLRDLLYISDAVIRVKSCKAGYFKSLQYQPVTQAYTKTLIPAKVETEYYTCRIGKFYYSSDLLCFYERKKVAKNFDLSRDPDNDSADDDDDLDKDSDDDDDDEMSNMMRETKIERPIQDNETNSTLPYTQAQDPEKSRIFYYPDKNDDIDEDDPDNDLGI